MLLGNFKRGKDKKKRKSRGLLRSAAIGGVGAGGIGAAISGLRNTTKNVATEEILKDPVITHLTRGNSSLTKRMFRDSVWDRIQSGRRSGEISSQQWKDGMKVINKTKLGRLSKAAAIGVGVGALGGLGYQALKNRRRSKNKGK